MTQQDFDVAQTAAYLHLTPAQVARMAEQGKLPGRRIAGEWRFHPVELHQWLEQKIVSGASEDLPQWERALAGQSTRDFSEEWPGVAASCPVELIAIPLLAKTRRAVFRDICELAARGGLLWDADVMANAVEARESLHSTALESGVALLHPRRPMPQQIADSFIALGVTPGGLPFGEASGIPTDVFFLLCSQDDRTHLQALARVSRMIGLGLPDRLRSATSASEAKSILEATEQELLEAK
jgi:PTS system nitrogen regulatory IIA component